MGFLLLLVIPTFQPSSYNLSEVCWSELEAMHHGIYLSCGKLASHFWLPCFRSPRINCVLHCSSLLRFFGFVLFHLLFCITWDCWAAVRWGRWVVVRCIQIHRIHLAKSVILIRVLLLFLHFSKLSHCKISAVLPRPEGTFECKPLI